MRRPGKLRFKGYTVKGDVAVLRQYLDSCETTYCHVPITQQHFIQRQIQEVLERNCGADVLQDEELWTNFFQVLLKKPLEETIRIKRCIAEMLDNEYHIRWEDCFGRLVYNYAMNIGPLTDSCEVEIQRLARLKLVDQTKVGLASEAEKKYDAQLVPMFRRVEKFKKANVSCDFSHKVEVKC